MLALSLCLSLAYVLVYGALLAGRVRSGAVTRAMLETPKLPFLVMGALETAGQVIGLYAASRLPGPLLPVLGQSFLLWQCACSAALLGRRPTGRQLAGVSLVAVGVAWAAAAPAFAGGGGAASAAAASGLAGSPAAAAASVAPAAALFVLSSLFPALDNVVKERLFAATERRLGAPLDLFVVNFSASVAQACFTLALLPLLCQLRGVSPATLPAYAQASGVALATCWPLAASYVSVNLIYNISMLRTLRSAGGVVTALVASATVPLTALAFTLPLPFLPPAPALTAGFWAGVAVLLAGILLFASNKPAAGAAHGAQQQQPQRAA